MRTITAELRAALALIAALTPPMPEPTYPGAPVIATCGPASQERLHVRRNHLPAPRWECEYYCIAIEWNRLVNPRPLTPAEYAEYGIPAPCTHAADEETGGER